MKERQNYLLESLHNFYRKSKLPAFITYGDINLGEAIADKVSNIYDGKVQNLSEFSCCEIGAGGGLVSKGFLDRMREKHEDIYEKLSLTLVDISKNNLKKSKNILLPHKGKVHLINTDSTSLPLKDESVDFLYSNELLDALPFKLYQRNGHSWHLTDYKKDYRTFMVHENSSAQDEIERNRTSNVCIMSNHHLSPPRLKRYIKPRKTKKADIRINSDKNHSFLYPVGAFQFLNESKRVMKNGSYAIHIDYFSENPYKHSLRLFLPDPERKIEVKLQEENGKLNSVMIPEDTIDMFDVTYDVPIGLIKKHSEDLKLKVETFPSQGLAFKDTEKGNESCIFVGELQSLLNCFSFPQTLRERINSEKLFDLNQIKKMIDERYTFFVPLKEMRNKVNDKFYKVLETTAVPYWFGISLEKMPQARSAEKFKEPIDSPNKYKTLILQKN